MRARNSYTGRMAKDKTVYTCTECGGSTPKWQGKCPSCGAWNTLIEGAAEAGAGARNRFASLAPPSEVAVLADIEAAEVARTPTGIGELDCVLGGGIVEGGAVRGIGAPLRWRSGGAAWATIRRRPGRDLR